MVDRKSMYVNDEQFKRISALQAAYIGKNKVMVTKTKFLDIMLDIVEKQLK